MTITTDHQLQTINHRRVVQEVYDRQVLHRMLGITPKLTTLAPKGPGVPRGASSRREAEAASVRSAWGEADMEPETEDEEGAAAAADAVESRYEIDSRRQPPKKRRRTGARGDQNVTAHTVYTTDDDDPHDDGYAYARQSRTDDGISEEEREYDLVALDEKGRDTTDAATASRRLYWSSKANMAGASDLD